MLRLIRASRVALASDVTPFKPVVRATTICAAIAVRQKMLDAKIQDLVRRGVKC